jgi:biotin synthase
MINHRQIENLLKGNNDSLFSAADSERSRHCGDGVHIRGIIEFSNVCSRNCAYCGLRRDNNALRRYALTQEEILATVALAEESGFRTVVLQSGENDALREEWLAETIRAVKNRFDVAVTLSVGVKPWDCYALWRHAGADRYLLKHEAASVSLYNTFHPDSMLDDRMSALRDLQVLGYQIGTGNIVGLPGQSSTDLAADILLAHTLGVDMAAFGPLVPHVNTPLAHAALGDLDLALRVIAAARLILGPVHIAATTALDAIAPDGREKALTCGANAIMVNLTPSPYRRLYDIYPKKGQKNSIRSVKDILARLGRPVDTGYGHSLKRFKKKAPEEGKGQNAGLNVRL